MKLEDQVCNLELSMRLKELGVKQESLWYWQKYHWPSSKSKGKWAVGDDLPGLSLISDSCSAFTVAELGEILYDCEWKLPYPAENNQRLWWHITGSSSHKYALTEANARAKCLIYLLENNKIKI